MQPQLKQAPSYWCSECQSYYLGTFYEERFLEDDYSEGTAEGELEFYTATIGSVCRCDADDVNFYENYSETWVCGQCSRVWGNDMASAMACCQGNYQWGNDGKLRCMPNLPKEREKAKSS